ncbi:MAG TPA: polyamine ABC transporter ATP-binding protein [Gammaproteobacteria bacterium]|jgi:putrescine transport system ATP-binding protein|nr:polyamine ABC transporter ATP-binding protein [Gammaproteobacteria bacterium]HIA87833.1 ABC transporter ATP-binding protein [Gammaproteobacteria bacterium]HIN58953.1 ABC transporter ATP-binding protein [Gammaproteobacteria bacterium]|tara:strand:- start:1627 stop:2772 length:1146 start_codon:yes stop_codon:yes gene_type:complete
MSDTLDHSDRPWLDPDTAPFIKVDGITKSFGGFTAVDQVDLEIFRGELFSLLGASGCGKTTLLRILAGLETPTSGKVWIDGVDITQMPAYERPVNMMFQSYALFPHMNVAQNVAYGLKRDGIPKEEIGQRVDQMLTMVELSGFAKRKPHQLSGGEQQRVALARALVKRPKVLLLDEPLAALDKRLREQTQYELMRIQEQLGVTFIVVTHDQQEAMTLSTRIAVMNEGRFIQVGPPTELYENPDNRFIASFIGSVNLFAGRTLTRDDHLYTIALNKHDLQCQVEHTQHLNNGSPIWVAVRPEKITISRTPVASEGLNQLTGTVDDIAYTGNLSTYRVKTQPGDIVEVTHPNQSRSRGSQLIADWNDTVYLHWTSADSVLLTE